MVIFQISGHLTEYAGGQAEISIDQSLPSVGAALEALWRRHVALRDRVLDERGGVRQHVNIFVDSQITRRDQVLQQPLSGDVEICIMPAVSGG
jgi:molybdopterin converting factor small subunit